MIVSSKTYSACAQKIAAKGKIGPSEADAIVQRVFERSEKLKGEGVADNLGQAAKEIGAEERARAIQAHADALRNAVTRETRLGEYKTEYRQDPTATGKKLGQNAYLSALSDLVEDPREKHTAMPTRTPAVEPTADGRAAREHSVWEHELKKTPGAYEAAVSGSMDKEVARRMYEGNAGKEISGDDIPSVIARANIKVADHMRDLQNNAGAHTGDSLDFVARTKRDGNKMLLAGPSKGLTPEGAFAKWNKFVKDRWADKTYDNLKMEPDQTEEQGREAFRRAVWEGATTGNRGPGSAPGDRMPAAYEGSRNIARAASQARTIFYKSADAWREEMEEYGTAGSVSHGVSNTIEQSSRNIALMNKFGTNPKANWELVMQGIKDDLRSDPVAAIHFEKKLHFLQATMAHLDGSANIPVNKMWADVTRSAQSVQVLARLGAVGLRHVTTFPITTTREAAEHGLSRLGTLGDVAQNLLTGAPSSEKMEILSQMGAYGRGINRDMSLNYSIDSGRPTGVLSNMAGRMMRWSGLNYAMQNEQSTIRETLGNQLARETGKVFEQLNPRLQQSLTRSAISAGDWELMRSIPDLSHDGVGSYMTAKDVERVDPAAVEALLRQGGLLADKAKPATIANAVQTYTYGLQDKLLSYYQGASDRSIVTPGAYEKALLLRGVQGQAGTPIGSAIRLAMQFKLWPIAAARQLIMRDVYLGLQRGQGAAGIGGSVFTMLALSAVDGYIYQTLTGLAQGKAPENPLKPSVLLSAFMNGGAAGIYGDLVSDQALRNIGSTVLGPTLGQVGDLQKAYTDFSQGKGAFPAAARLDLAKQAVGNIPFANLLYAKGAMNYLLWYHLYNAVSPGWWERHNQAMQKATGHVLAGYVPGRGVPIVP